MEVYLTKNKAAFISLASLLFGVMEIWPALQEEQNSSVYIPACTLMGMVVMVAVVPWCCIDHVTLPAETSLQKV